MMNDYGCHHFIYLFFNDVYFYLFRYFTNPLKNNNIFSTIELVQDSNVEVLTIFSPHDFVTTTTSIASSYVVNTMQNDIQFKPVSKIVSSSSSSKT